MVFILLTRELSHSELAHIKNLHKNMQNVNNCKFWQTIIIDEINNYAHYPYVKGSLRTGCGFKIDTRPSEFITSYVLSPYNCEQYKLCNLELKEWLFKSSFSNSNYTANCRLPKNMNHISKIILL